MAECRRYLPNQQLDLEQILHEAHHRWLRPTEICEILRNYQKFHLTPDPPVKPPAGSLFLFDRKALRYFRKDGHRWRKKKDGKTVKEAHEKLKAGSVDVLHCYYAHGEDNENFQRRSYWMLDGQLEHIVLVHYREVKEGYRSSISRLLPDPGLQIDGPQTSSAPLIAQSNSPAPPVQTSYVSRPYRTDWNGCALSSDFEDVDSKDDLETSSLARPIYGSMLRDASFLQEQVAGVTRNPLASWFPGAKIIHGTGSSRWPGSLGSSRKEVILDQKFHAEQPSTANFVAHKLTDARLDTDSGVPDPVASQARLMDDLDFQAVSTSSQELSKVPHQHSSHTQFQNYSGEETGVASSVQLENKLKVGDVSNNESGELKKLDSFGRWMDKEIGGDCNDSLMASDSGNYWNTLDAENENKEVSSLSRHMQLDIDSLGPSLSQEQLFSIHDFSPDWAYSGAETKVLIIGTFLGSKKRSTDTRWGCMFGEIEVSAEVLTNNVIRCQAPSHAPGRVPFYVTCSNRLACSEVRDFEFREKPAGATFAGARRSAPEEEINLQVRLAKLLYLSPERRWLDCTTEACDGCKLKNIIYSMKGNLEKDWGKVVDAAMVFGSEHINYRDKLIQNLLKDKFFEWLVSKVHEGGKGALVLDNKGQGVIHLAAALGYEWAMGPLVAAGVSPNFRDTRGRTGLHWASSFGREDTVIELLRVGGASGAVDDPTPEFPGGQTAADLASGRGHKGIAGYLAEADLTSHFSLFTVNHNVVDNVAASIGAETSMEIAAQGVPSDEQLLLEGCRAAVRKSAHAAACIQAAFRARSFHYRQLTKSSDDISEVSVDLVALGSLNKVKTSHFEDYLHSAAVKIQQKYRGWKGRKEFLKIRKRIVKIQAHVRGHQVRKQYKKVVWSVSIVEKAILRWRRKRCGLRGFRAEKSMGNTQPDIEKTDEYEFLRIGRKQKFAGVENALARVKSMVRHPEARDQYMRLVTRFENLKMDVKGINAQLKDENLTAGKGEKD